MRLLITIAGAIGNEGMIHTDIHDDPATPSNPSIPCYQAPQVESYCSELQELHQSLEQLQQNEAKTCRLGKATYMYGICWKLLFNGNNENTNQLIVTSNNTKCHV